ncbi:MAG TPA: hypothetical protein VGP57_25300, partial [Actinoplanes sp.]|nr:hypothetical protein [Actinoplanes sp.]
MTRRLTAIAVTALMLLAGCTSGNPAGTTATTADQGPGDVTEGAATTRLAAPVAGGRGSIAGTLPAAASPTKSPAQAGDLAGQAVPTN